MKVLSCFAKVADKEKFKKDGYFTKFIINEEGESVSFSDQQEEHIELVYKRLCELDELPTFDLTIELSSGMATYEMVSKITEMLLPIMEVESQSVIIHLTLKFLDVVSSTWTTHKDKILISYTYSKLRIRDGMYKAEYSYMVKMYLADILKKCVTEVSVAEIMDMLKLEV